MDAIVKVGPSETPIFSSHQNVTLEIGLDCRWKKVGSPDYFSSWSDPIPSFWTNQPWILNTHLGKAGLPENRNVVEKGKWSCLLIEENQVLWFLFLQRGQDSNQALQSKGPRNYVVMFPILSENKLSMTFDVHKTCACGSPIPENKTWPNPSYMFWISVHGGMSGVIEAQACPMSLFDHRPLGKKRQNILKTQPRWSLWWKTV